MITTSATRMWSLIDQGVIVGVYGTRTAARQARQGGLPGTIKPVLVSLA